jgi:hypothetical protein
MKMNTVINQYFNKQLGIIQSAFYWNKFPEQLKLKLYVRELLPLPSYSCDTKPYYLVNNTVCRMIDGIEKIIYLIDERGELFHV